MVYSSIVLFSILVLHVLYWTKLSLVSIRVFSTSNTSARQKDRLETLYENRLNLDCINQNTFYLIKWYEQTKNWNKIFRTKYRRKLLHAFVKQYAEVFLDDSNQIKLKKPISVFIKFHKFSKAIVNAFRNADYKQG